MIDRICLQSYLLGFKIWVPCWHGQQNRAFAALMFKINRAGMPQDLVLRVAVAIRTIVVASGHPEIHVNWMTLDGATGPKGDVSFRFCIPTNF